MADREFIVTFDGDEARVALAPRPSNLPSASEPYWCVRDGKMQYRILAPDSRRAELIARAMRKPTKEKP